MRFSSFLLFFKLLFKISLLNGLDYGNKRLNEWTFLTAHNSHVNWDDSSVMNQLNNQNFGIDKQLEYGVRGFMFDIDWKTCSSLESFFKNCKCEGWCSKIKVWCSK
jgi:hypothetical protein